MAKIGLDLIQKLRERTGSGMMDCKKALEETQGDLDKATEILRRKGAAIAEKRGNNATSEGLIHAYIHPGARVGVLIEIDCETDFVARTDEMKQFAQDVCLHIAAFAPKYLAPEDVDANYLGKEKEFFQSQIDASKKPAAVVEQILQGKLNKLFTEICLIKQPFVKNDKLTVEEVLKDLMGKMGENIKIRRFSRFEIGA